MNLINWITICVVLYLFVITPVSAVANAGFETGDFTNWNDVCGDNAVGTIYANSGTYGAKIAAPGCPSTRLEQSIGLGTWLSLDRRIIDTSEADFVVFWQGISPSGNEELYREVGSGGWDRIYIDTSARSGNYGNIIFTGTSYTSDGFEVWIDDVSTSEAPYGDLSGYVHDNYGYPIGPAYISINLSGFNTESDDFGYYELNDIPNGNYLLTVTSGQNYDFTANLSITTDVEYNVTVTRKLPDIISGPFIIETSQTSLRIGWTENSVTDSVKIFKGTNTNLIYTMDTSYTYINSYTDSNLECGTFYNYWIQPFDNAVEGSKYQITGETENCDISAIPPFIPETPTPTPTETPPPDDDEEEEGIIEIIDEIIDNTIEDLSEFFDETLIEPTKVVIEEVIVHVTTTFNWILLIFIYLGVLAARMMNRGNDLVMAFVDTLFYGTIALLFILILTVFGVLSLLSNEMIATIVFIVVGIIFGFAPEYLKKENIGND